MGGSDDHRITAVSCNTGLSLGLGGGGGSQNQFHHLINNYSNSNNGANNSINQRSQQQATLRFDHVVPSLSLGPVAADDHHPITMGTSNSTAYAALVRPSNYYPHRVQIPPASTNISPPGSSSYSNTNTNSSSLKRCSDQEDKGGEEEVEGGDGNNYYNRNNNNNNNNNGKVGFSRVMVSDEDEEASPRKKLRLTKEQSAVLEDSFKEHSTLNPNQKRALAKQLNLRARQVEVWFQNRRARTKLKQTEMDRELLKKCYETLTEENKKLQQEIQELRSLNTTITTTPAAAAASINSLCPSCERRRVIMSSSHHHHRRRARVSSYNNNATPGPAVSTTTNPPRELSFSITSSSAAC